MVAEQDANHGIFEFLDGAFHGGRVVQDGRYGGNDRRRVHKDCRPQQGDYQCRRREGAAVGGGIGLVSDARSFGLLGVSGKQSDNGTNGGGENTVQGTYETLGGKKAGYGILQDTAGQIQNPCESGLDDRIRVFRTFQKEKSVKTGTKCYNSIDFWNNISKTY